MNATRTIRTLFATALLIGAWWVLLGPSSIGGPITYVVVRGDSMLPTFESGDLVLIRGSERYASGDIVAYRVPAGELGEGLVVIHRIVGGDSTSGFEILGDNNPAPDPWRPMPADVVGAPILHIPLVGRAIVLLHQPAIAGALAAALVVGLVISGSGAGNAGPAGPRRRPTAGGLRAAAAATSSPLVDRSILPAR